MPRLPKDSPLADRVRNGVIDLRESTPDNCPTHGCKYYRTSATEDCSASTLGAMRRVHCPHTVCRKDWDAPTGAKALHRTHKAEVEAIRKYVQAKGGACYVLHQSGRLHGSAGIPDLYIFLPGRMGVWMEVKVGKDALSPAQQEFKRLAQKAGDLVLIGALADLIELAEW